MITKKLNRDEWNRASAALPSRAEELAQYTETFADTVFLDVLKAKKNQVIFGRRGTGKTHLLRRLEEEYVHRFDDHHVVPIYINSRQLRAHAKIAYQSPQATAFALYVEFVKSTAQQIHEFIESRLSPSILDKIFEGDQTQRMRSAQRLASTLYALLHHGEALFLPVGEASHEIRTLQEAQSSLSGRVQLNLSDPRNLGWKVEVGAGQTRELEESGITLRTIQGQIVLPFSEVSERIVELLGLIDASSLVVLFDEWSDIDRRLETQPYLADMLKRTFSSISQMHIKLACVPVRTRLATPVTSEDPIPIGYEEGDDISSDIDLDTLIFLENDLSQFLPFFLTLLHRHLSASLDWVASMSLSEFRQTIENEIFENLDVFSELCQASAGVPRDFLEIFSTATALQTALGRPKMQLIHVRDAAQAIYEAKRRSFAPQSKLLEVLELIYKRIVAEHQTYFFLVAQEDVWHPALRMLWTERLVHRIPAHYYDPDTHTRYVYYQLDYGKYVDLLSIEAALKGREQGKKLSAALQEYRATNWLSDIIADAFSSDLADFMEEVKRRERLASQPAGSLAPDPKEIMLPKWILDKYGN